MLRHRRRHQRDVGIGYRRQIVVLADPDNGRDAGEGVGPRRGHGLDRGPDEVGSPGAAMGEASPAPGYLDGCRGAFASSGGRTRLRYRSRATAARSTGGGRACRPDSPCATERCCAMFDSYRSAAGVGLHLDEVGAVGQVGDVERLAGQPLVVGVSPARAAAPPAPTAPRAAARGAQSLEPGSPLGVLGQVMSMASVGSEAEGLLLADDGGGLVGCQQFVRRELRKCQWVARAECRTRTSPRGRAPTCCRRRRSTGRRPSAASSDGTPRRPRARDRHPHVGSERQPVPRVPMVHPDAERGQRDQVGHGRRIGVVVDRHLRVR